jgi:hypothetical protein
VSTSPDSDKRRKKADTPASKANMPMPIREREASPDKRVPAASKEETPKEVGLD